MVTQSTHFANAGRFIPILAIAGFGSAMTGLTLAVVASTGMLGRTIDLGVLGLIGASLLIAASGFLASALICEGRHRVIVAQERESGASASSQNQWLGLRKGVDPSSLPSESEEASKRLARMSGWPQSF